MEPSAESSTIIKLSPPFVPLPFGFFLVRLAVGEPPSRSSEPLLFRPPAFTTLSDVDFLPFTKWPFAGAGSTAGFFLLGIGEVGGSISDEAGISRPFIGLSSIAVFLVSGQYSYRGKGRWKNSRLLDTQDEVDSRVFLILVNDG